MDKEKQKVKNFYDHWETENFPKYSTPFSLISQMPLGESEEKVYCLLLNF